MEELKNTIKAIEQLFVSCSIDYELLINEEINLEWFKNYNNQRIVNSFLFNYIKIQDKIGAKLFKNLLYSLKELDDFSTPMIDVLHLLEKLDIISSIEEWDKLREIRNILTHEYPFDIEERIDNIELCLESFDILLSLFSNIKAYINKKGIEI